MKKIYLTVFIIITCISLLGQKELIIETGDIISKSEPLDGDNSYQFLAGSYAEFLNNFEYLPTAGNYLQAKTNPLLVFPPEIGITGGSANNNEGGVFGTIAGDFTVNPSGAAVYSVPINVPTGTSGMTPELALVYNSQFDDGYLGERWTLSGLSAITLAPKTYYYDGVSEGVELPQVLGPFYLDGKRLLEVGQNSSNSTIEYRTEVDEFNKIVAYTVSFASVAFFKVYTKSGLIYEYGYTSNALHLLKDEVSGNMTKIAWYVNKISDRLGNYIEFEYYQDEINGELRIKEIRYTGNTNTGLLPYNKIEFIYGSDREEVIETNFKATISSTNCLTARITKYLTGIKCYTVEDEIYRKYTIEYETGGVLFKRHIKKIYEKVSDETYYNPLVFNWELQSEDFDFLQYPLSGNFTSAQTNPTLFPGDFNGNGRTDFVNVWYDENAGEFKMAVNYDNPSSLYSFIQGTVKTLSSNPESVTVLDFNGDGFSDIIVEYNGPEFEFYMMGKDVLGEPYLWGPFDIFTDLSYPNNIFTKQLISGDFNGDGITDILIAYRYSEGVVHYIDLHIYFGNVAPLSTNKIEKTRVLSTPNRLKTGDFDGDGKTEILITDMSNNESFIYDIQGDDINGYEFIYLINSNSVATLDSKIEVGDFNGDKKADVLYYTSSNYWKIYLSCGNDFMTPISRYEENVYNDKLYPCDFNGDGRTDILVTPDYENGGSWSGVKIWVATTDGKDFTEVNVNLNENPIIDTTTVIIPGNFTGNGRTDFITREGELSSPEYNLYKITEGLTNGHRNLIKSITNGLGDQFEILYEPMTNYTVYSSEIPVTENKENTDYPISNFVGPLYLVKRVIQNTNSGDKTISYYYRAAKTHRYGKGFLGFLRFEQTDLNTYIKTVQYYDYDDTFYHVYFKGSKTEKYYTISFVENTINFKINPDNPLVFYPYTNIAYSKTFELNGDFIKSSKTIAEYDDYGNLTYMKNLNGDYNFNNGIPPNSYFDYWEEVNNTYLPADEENWILGRLETATVTKHIPDPQAEDITRESEFQYYPNGLLWKETFEPSNPKSVTKEYFYDGYGNIIKTKRSVSGLEPRIIETEYDTDIPPPQRKGRFLTKTTNGLGHTESKIYDQIKGVALEVTGPNSFTTQFQYDDFGNLIKTIGHTGIEATSVLRWVQTFDSDAPDGAVYYLWSKQSGSPPVIIYYDNRGKQLRTVNIGFDGTKIFTDYDYNYRELLISLSDPYFKGTPVQDILYTTFTYDILSRKTTTTLPGDRVTTINYNGLITELTNPEGQTTKKEVNELGWIKKSYDATEQNYVDFEYYSNGLVRKRYLHNHPETEIIKYYDVFGNCTTLVDPALGTIDYEYNGFGELTKKTKNGDIVANNFIYDVLGRLIEKQEPLDDRRYIFSYDTEPNGIGKPSFKKTLTDTYTLINKISYTYDSYGRVKNETEIVNINGVQESFVTTYQYDVFSRLKYLIYPSGFSLKYKYNPNGYLGKIVRNYDKKTIWQLTQMNARQQIENIQLGNGLNTTFDYYTNTGFLKSIETVKTGVNIQDLGYGWDNIGNLKWRDKNTQEGNYLIEGFDYDNLNRLKQVDIDYYSGQATIFTNYDELGRVLCKKSINSLFHVADNYTYDGDGDNNPYNLWKIDNNPAFYQNEDQEIFYTKFDKIHHIDQGGKTLDIVYGLGHSRKIQTIADPDNNFEQTKVYIGGLYEKVIENGQTKEVHYITAGDGLCAIYTKKENMANQFVYVHKDHLGSIQAITDETGLLIEEYSYDAWGLRRGPNSWIPLDTPEQVQTERGFTGHEHIDLFALVNMNGRMYDPVVGYFTTPDPYSQFPGYTQGFNRYSYTLNNPLSLTDPNGYFSMFRCNFTWNDVFNTTATVAVVAMAIVASVETAGLASPIIGETAAAILGGAVGGFVGGYGTTVINGGDFNDAVAAGLQGAVIGAISAGFSSAVGSAINSGASSNLWSNLATELGRSLAHGAFQGVVRVAQGGKFIHGFMAGAVSSISGSASTSWGLSSEMSVIVGAALGGTAEALGGGKFANGAITGAFVVLFNHLMHPPQTGATPERLTEEQKKQLLLKIKDASEKERARNLEEQDTYNVEVDESIVSDFNIEGLPKKDAMGLYEFYNTGKVEISFDNIIVEANIIYSPSANSNNNIVRYIGDYRTDYTNGRFVFRNQNGYPVAELQFYTNSDYKIYKNYIYGGK